MAIVVNSKVYNPHSRIQSSTWNSGTIPFGSSGFDWCVWIRLFATAVTGEDLKMTTKDVQWR
jgi:hypothetical protein